MSRYVPAAATSDSLLTLLFKLRVRCIALGGLALLTAFSVTVNPVTVVVGVTAELLVGVDTFDVAVEVAVTDSCAGTCNNS
jgi:hypothetical protein